MYCQKCCHSCTTYVLRASDKALNASAELPQLHFMSVPTCKSYLVASTMRSFLTVAGRKLVSNLEAESDNHALMPSGQVASRESRLRQAVTASEHGPPESLAS